MTSYPTLAQVEEALDRRWPENRVDPTLDRVAATLHLLGDPHRQIPAIHITGTNGKSTTARMAAELLRADGLRVGRYTSPHLVTVRERIVIDDAPIDAATFVDTFHDVLPAIEKVDALGEVPLSFFEVVTTIALVAFASAGVDAMVIEVGMGGTWDATNVVDGRVAVIAPIGLDHTDYLGPDEVSIAREKAGIIKSGAVAVVADQRSDVAAVLRNRVLNVGATLVVASEVSRIVQRSPQPGGQRLWIRSTSGTTEEVSLPLLGAYQADNARLAVSAVDAFLAEIGRPALDVRAVRRGLAAVRAPGRLEPVRQAPPVLVDASHNPAGMQAAASAVAEAYPKARIAVVLAVLEGKDATGIARALDPIAGLVVVTQNRSRRCRRADDLAREVQAVLVDQQIEVEPDFEAAVRTALRWVCGDDAAVLITGSVVTAGEARELLRGATD